MTVWELFVEGKSGALHLGMLASEAVGAFGQPDNSATNADGEPTILKYDEFELHFQNRVLWLIHSETQHYTDSANALGSARLGLSPPEFQWPVELDDVETSAKKAGIRVEHGYDPLGNPQLCLGLAVITIADGDLVLSVTDYSLLTD